MRTSVCGRQLAAPGLRRLSSPGRARPAPLPVRPGVCASAGRSGGMLRTFETALLSAEARVAQWIAELGGGAVVTSRFQSCLLGLLLALQRLLRWVQLTTLALQLAASSRTQQQLAFAGAGGSLGGDGGVSTHLAATSGGPHQPPQQQHQQQSEGSEAAQGSSVLDFLSAATTGAVEQLRHTLTDATEGMESKWLVIERTASSVQETLFQAAQAHSEAVRSNPEGGMWKQPTVEAVISEEERLRQTVFAQVYAELLQKDNKSISFQAPR